MSSAAALIRLAESSSEAVVGILEMFAAGQVRAGDVAVLEAGSNPLAGLPYPAVATNVSYVDGVTGGNVFVMTLEGARRLAAAMMGASEPEPAAPGQTELSELELSAVSEAMNQMMATAAGAISTVLGTEVEIGTPETRTFLTEADSKGAYPASPHMVRAAFSVCGEPCRLVQLVPNAFVVRMDRAHHDRALDELSAETAPTTGGAELVAAPAPKDGAPSLAGIPVRVWAELGRASMSTADVVGLPHGAVVELDRAPDEPIDLFVNGRRFATGRLVVVDGNDWAVRIESVLAPDSDTSEIEGEVARWPVSS
jgi:flagellar motor switch protein FliN